MRTVPFPKEGFCLNKETVTDVRKLQEQEKEIQLSGSWARSTRPHGPVGAGFGWGRAGLWISCLTCGCCWRIRPESGSEWEEGMRNIQERDCSSYNTVSAVGDKWTRSHIWDIRGGESLHWEVETGWAGEKALEGSWGDWMDTWCTGHRREGLQSAATTSKGTVLEGRPLG